MDHLDTLEAESIYVLREAYAKFDKLAILWSLGKDSNVVLWLTRKAFFGHVPLPVLHVDTGKKFRRCTISARRYSKEWGLKLLVEPCPPIEQMDPSLPPAARSAARKTAGLNAALARHGFSGLIAGIRRDEEGTRAKERYFSPRTKDNRWDLKDQPPEFWNQYMTSFPGHARAHPSAAALERDRRLALHPARGHPPDRPLLRQGRQALSLARRRGHHASGREHARTLEQIIAELETTKVAERSGRAMDHEAEDAFERLRAAGYM